MSEEKPEEMNGPERSVGGIGADTSPEGMSPYATGGGGVTFERKVAVQYLAHLLVGDGASELGDGRCVVSVAFQQAPDHSVDDLVVSAAHPDELRPSLVLALSVRRSPKLVVSDESTRNLIQGFVRAVINAPTDGPEHRWGLVVAGPQTHAKQLAVLAHLAAAQMDASGFFTLVRTPGKFAAGVRDRLEQLEKLVKRALDDLGVAEADTALVKQRAWQLLARFTVAMPRLESPDEMDWLAVANSLIPVARDSDLPGASQLRDRLVSLASEYSPNSARVDMTLLLRDAHTSLYMASRRRQPGWRMLDHLHDMALASVRDEIAAGDGASRVHLNRSDAVADLLGIAMTGPSVVVTGESGVGKSALALLSLTAAGAADPHTLQALCINLRQVPKLTVEFENVLGCPLSVLLCELSAPRRVLIVDGADAVGEGMDDAFRYLVDAARESDVKVIAVTAIDKKKVVCDTLSERFADGVAEYVVPPLSDSEIDEVLGTFPELGHLSANRRSRGLLRRLVVIDLLVRGGVCGVPLSDADAMREVWSGLVRRREVSDRGSPDARELVLLKLAALALSDIGKVERLDGISGLDPTALAGLRRDGLLGTPGDDPFMIGPEFAHDEVRRYAVARFLLMDRTPVSRLMTAGAPRWSLAAARLACQELLAEANTPGTPLRGRFAALQASFDELVDAGHGARWGDVPGEALITLANPGAVLRDAWPQLLADDAAGLRRLARLVDQRLRGDNGIVEVLAVEPIIALLLEAPAPWQSGKYAQDLLRDWLQGHVLTNTAPGHPLRILLCERLVEACAAADRRLAEKREAAVAARTPEQVEQDRRFVEDHSMLFSEIGYGGRNRRQRPEIAREITDEIVLELLALLGPDLGAAGEAILRRVAQDAPAWLAPAVEELLTGGALASYRRGLLAQLTEAYYLDDEADGFDIFDDGIRSHHARSFGVAALFAWYRGPFMPLFQTDFRNGVAVLNRMLNHAARIRVRNLARPAQMGRLPEDDVVASYQTELMITGARQLYVGDQHVWLWYRGTGVGPYPCFSALQALERVCDQQIERGTPISKVVSILIDGCESLAMVSFVVGLLVRHLEHADHLLDPYLTEPAIWEYEFARVANETAGLAASSEGLVAPERRNWSLREVAMFMVVRTNANRAADLRKLGERLVANARRHIESTRAEEPEVEADTGDSIEQQLVPVRAWASSLDRDRYQAHEVPDGLYIQATPSEDIVQALKHSNEDLECAQEATRLVVRYYIEPKKECAEAIGHNELAADIATARKLLENPPSLRAHDPWDTAALVAAAALEAHLLGGADLSDDALFFAADTVLRIAKGEAPARQYEFEETLFEQGADRSAARVLPLLLLPIAALLRSAVEKAGEWATFECAARAGVKLAQAGANEVRLHLARGLDYVWTAPCVEDGRCHHEVGWQIATETMRHCVLGSWAPDTGRRSVLSLEEPFAESLASTDDDSILASRLDAAIRALAPAAMANICVSTRARDLLLTLLAGQRRSLLSHEHGDTDPRDSHTLVSARALLTLAEHGNDAAIYEHIDAYADNSALLSKLLRALSAAAEETPDRAATARRIWPNIVRYVLELNDSGHAPFRDHHYGDWALATLMPNAAHEVTFLHREVQDDPITWWNPLALRSEVEAWLVAAADRAICADQLIGFLGVLAPGEHVRIGLPWVATLVLADPVRIAGRSFMVSTWLTEMRAAAVDAGLLAKWQEVVDALVVAGVTRLAPYSE